MSRGLRLGVVAVFAVAAGCRHITVYEDPSGGSTSFATDWG